MRPRAIAMAGLAIAILALAATATAQAAVWSSPQTLSRAHMSIYDGAAGATSSGMTVASWRWQDGVGASAKVGGSFASRPAAAVTFGRERELPAGVTAAPAPYGARRMVVATQTAPDRASRSTLGVRLGDLSGGFGTSQIIARRRRNLVRVHLAANKAGDAALAWSEDQRRIYVSVRPPGGRFGPARLLGTGTIRGVSVAVSPAGDVLVAWDARGRVRTRSKPHTARAFLPVDQLRSQTTFYAALQTAIAADGRAWIAWTSQLLTEGGGQGDAYVQVARRAPKARRFDRALLLDHGSGTMTAAPVSLAIRSGGHAVVAWSMTGTPTPSDTTVTTVDAAKLVATGAAAVTPLARYAAPEGGDVSVGYADDGSATAAWTRPTVGTGMTGTAAFASWSAPGGGWGAPELVSAGPLPFGPDVGPAPSGAAPTVLFANRAPGAGSGFVMQATSRSAGLVASTRPGAANPFVGGDPVGLAFLDAGR